MERVSWMLALATVAGRARRQRIGLCVAGKLGVRALYTPTTHSSSEKLKRRTALNGCSLLHTDAEALQVTFDPSVVTYRQLIEFFYRMHDPTTKDRQGPDMGTQYRSAIFTHSDEQNKIAHDITDKVSKQWFKKPVTTEILALEQWWDAEDYHQLYLNKNPSGYECPSQYVVPLDVFYYG